MLRKITLMFICLTTFYSHATELQDKPKYMLFAIVPPNKNIIYPTFGGVMPPFKKGEIFYLWNGANSRVYLSEVAGINQYGKEKNGVFPFAEINIQNNKFIEKYSPRCSQYGMDYQSKMTMDKRGQYFFVAVSKPIPKQRWSCMPISEVEINAMAKAASISSKKDLGFTKIKTDSKIIYQISKFSGAQCGNIFLIKSAGVLKIIATTPHCALEPFVDVTGDGIPEFVNVFPDSIDANLVQVFPKEKVLSSHSSGM